MIYPAKSFQEITLHPFKPDATFSKWMNYSKFASVQDLEERFDRLKETDYVFKLDDLKVHFINLFDQNYFACLKFFLNLQDLGKHLEGLVKGSFLEKDRSEQILCLNIIKYIKEFGFRDSLRAINLLKDSTSVYLANAQDNFQKLDSILNDLSHEKKDLMKCLMFYSKFINQEYSRANEIMETIDDLSLKAQIDYFFRTQKKHSKCSLLNFFKIV